jgi:glycosyltransferase involved in cell wall biosynthesis
LRVTHVVPAADPNPLLLDLLRALSDRNVVSEVVTLDRMGPLDQLLTTDGDVVAHLGSPGTRDVLRAVARLHRHLRTTAPDVVHSGMFLPGVVTELARRRTGARTGSVFTRHHDLSHHLERRRLHVQIDAWTARSADAVVAPSAAVRRTLLHLERVPADRVVTVPHGVDARRIEPSEEEVRRWQDRLPQRPLIVTASRVDPLKGFPTLLRTLALVRTQHPGACLAVAGASVTGYDDIVREQARDLGVLDAVHLLGRVSDVHALMRAGDVYCSASEAESFGLSVLEAGLLGVPLAVTTPGGVAETLAGEHPDIGAGDVDSLTRRVLAHLADPQQATAEATKTARRLRERFGIDAMADGHLRVYEHVVRRSGQRR